MLTRKLSLSLSALAIMTLTGGATMAQSQDSRSMEALHESQRVLDRIDDIAQGDTSSLEGATSEDVRLRAMKEAAFSIGAQEGYLYQINQLRSIIEQESDWVDAAFDFRTLLKVNGTDASEKFVIPPVIEEVNNAMAMEEDGSQIKLSGTVYRILSNVRLSSAPPNWRQYLFPVEDKPSNAPPKDLLPKDSDEKQLWAAWVQEGFQSGLEIADIEMRDRIRRLKTDFKGMVRYMRLAAENKVKEPVVAMEHINVEGDGDTMKIRSSIYSITEGASFETDIKEWRPISYEN